MMSPPTIHCSSDTPFIQNLEVKRAHIRAMEAGVEHQKLQVPERKKAVVIYQDQKMEPIKLH
jgi:hypothetical protein